MLIKKFDNALGNAGAYNYELAAGAIISTTVGSFTVVSFTKEEDDSSWSDEGEGTVRIVFKHDATETLFMKSGSYSSWDDYEWYLPLTPVLPKEVVSVEYVPTTLPEVTVGQVEDIIEDLGGYSEVRYSKTEETDLGPLEVIASQGGEGQGQVAWIVFELAGETFRKTGYYASWDGFTWDGPLAKVEAREVTKVEYFDI